MSNKSIISPHPSPTPINNYSHSSSSSSNNTIEFRKSCAIHEKLLNADIDLIINSKIFTELNLNDIIEIYPIERGYNNNSDENNRLIIKVDNIQAAKGTFPLSLSTTMVELFHMYKITSQEVSIKIVKPEVIHLNFVELSFKDDYISRADMWRFFKIYFYLF